MTRKEAIRQTRQENVLMSLGLSSADAETLRRVSMTLHRWHEMECGTGEGQTSISIERDGDEPNSKPFLRTQYPTRNGYIDTRHPIADRETGALKRLNAVMAKHPHLTAYVQGDPRGCALYILRPGDVPEGAEADAYYSRGIAVY